jgi:hypothetical protein
MSILNYNNALSANFKITFPKFPELEFYAVSINIPTTQLSAIEVAYRDTRAKVPDDKFEWDDINIQFILDENLYVYELMKKWNTDARNVPNWLDAMLDIVVQPLDSNKSIEYSFVLQGAFPTVVNGWQYNSALMSSEAISFDVVFAYQDFSIKRIKELEFHLI